jgi:predicted aminopeptidase
VHLAEIGGYSTLGWFDDPLYSSQLAWSESGLAQLLGHEIAHERLYFKNDTEFSELLASFIEKKLAADYINSANLPVTSAVQKKENQRRNDELVDLIMTLRATLEKLYSASLPSNEELAKKTALINELNDTLTKRRSHFGIKKLPEINNASLAQFHRYTPKGKAFENVYTDCQHRDPSSVYSCWFGKLEQLKSCSNAKRRAWREGDGKISATTCP